MTVEPPPRSPLTRARKVLGRIRRRFNVDTFDVFARPVRAEDERFEDPEGYRFAWATPEEIAACDPYHTELDEHERRAGVERLGFGHRAVICFHDALAVFTMWVNPRNLNVPGGVKRKLEDDEVFIYKAYTSPDHRGRALYKLGMRFVLADLAERGMRRLVGYAHVKKAVSRKGLAALGFDTLGRFHVLDMPGVRRTFVSAELVRNFPEDLPRSGVLKERSA